MLKYTLGALAALVIVLTTGFIILAQVTDGGADIGPAQVVIFTIHEDGVIPVPVLTAPQGSVISLGLHNRSQVARSIRLDSENVEQLPAAAKDHGAVSPYRSGIEIIAGPASVGSALVRFKEKGSYTLNVGYAGVLLPPTLVTIIVE